MSEVQSEIALASTQEIENLLDKANGRLSSHREWLANLPRDSDKLIPSITQPSSTLVTTPPLLRPRQSNPPLSECKDISLSAYNAGANSASSVFSASFTSASRSIESLSSALASAESSASVALSSATSSIFVAEISMNSAISEAEKSASLMVASAAEMVASASAALNEAKGRATSEIQKAEASIISNNQAAQASILASETAAMNTTKFALSLTFAILGSSIITIILFYLTIRWRAHRKERRQAELKEKIHRRNNTPSPFLPPNRLVNYPDARRIERPKRLDPQYEVPTGIIDTTQENATRSRTIVNNDVYKMRPGLEPIPSEEDLIISSNKGKEFKSSIDIETNEKNKGPLKQNGDGENGIPPEPIPNPLVIQPTDISPSERRQKFLKRRNTEGFKPAISEETEIHEKHQTFSPSSTRSNWPSQTRKPTLQYDPERPTDPPTWLDTDDSVGRNDDLTLSPFSTSRESCDQSREGKVKTDIGTAI